MKIVIVRHSIYDRGGDRVVMEYADHLAACGHQVEYWTNTIVTSLQLSSNVVLRRIPWPGVAGTILFMACTSFKADVVLVDLVVMAALAGLRNRGRVVLLSQDHDVNYYRSAVFRSLTAGAYRHVLFSCRVPVISVSAKLSQELQRYHPFALTTVSNGVDTTFFFRDGGSVLIDPRRKKRVIAMFSRRDRRKGTDVGVAAMKVFERIYPGQDWEWWVIGDPLPADAPRHRHFGFIKEATRIRDLFSAADIYLVPSRGEGLSILLLQAIACGCCVVGTEAVNIIRHGQDGYVSAIEDASALAENLVKALADPLFLKTAGESARSLAVKFDSALSRDQFEKALVMAARSGTFSTESCPLCAGEGRENYSVLVAGVVYRVSCCPTCMHVFRAAAAQEPDIPYGAMDDPDQTGFLHERLLRPFLSWCSRRDALMLMRSIRQDTPRLLDIGCGTGWVTAEYSRCGCVVEGLDSSAVRRDQARRYPAVRIHPCSLEKFLPAPGQNYDVVVMRHVFEHFKDPVAALDKVRTLLRPGGIVFVVVPSFAGLGFSIFRKDWVWGLPEHWQFFTPASLRGCLTREGFDVVRLTSVPAPMLFYYTVGKGWRLLLMPFFLLAGLLFNKGDVLVCTAVRK